MYCTSDIIVTFVIQSYILPQIQPNFWNYFGAALITLAMTFIMGFKLIDAKREKQMEKDAKLGIAVQKSSCFNRFIFFKF
jgi:accessory gene regulator protein AgrB